MNKEEKFQHILNEWCKEYCVPSIKVELVSKLYNAQAEFDADNYQILILKNTTQQVLRHEFCHYIIWLIQKASDAEEKICDTFEEVKI